MQTLQRNTSFVVQKSVVIQVYGAYIFSGMGILEACRVAGTSMGFLNKLFGGGPKEVYADFFGILTSAEDATDERLERELESG